MNTFCFESQKDWDNGICMLLFVVREAFSRISKFIILDAISISYYVEYIRHKFKRACEIKRQDKMKQWYDKNAMIREFSLGEKVFA